MDNAQRIAALAFQELGYFVREGSRVGLNEIDLLGIKIDRKGVIVDRIHAEISVSANPVGVLRPRGTAKGSLKNVLKSADNGRKRSVFRRRSSEPLPRSWEALTIAGSSFTVPSRRPSRSMSWSGTELSAAAFET
jgi:hypothetical protein